MRTVGDQAWNGTVGLGAGTAFTAGGNATFAQALNAAGQPVSVAAAGAATFNGAVMAGPLAVGSARFDHVRRDARGGLGDDQQQERGELRRGGHGRAVQRHGGGAGDVRGVGLRGRGVRPHERRGDVRRAGGGGVVRGHGGDVRAERRNGRHHDGPDVQRRGRPSASIRRSRRAGRSRSRRRSTASRRTHQAVSFSAGGNVTVGGDRWDEPAPRGERRVGRGLHRRAGSRRCVHATVRHGHDAVLRPGRGRHAATHHGGGPLPVRRGGHGRRRDHHGHRRRGATRRGAVGGEPLDHRRRAVRPGAAGEHPVGHVPRRTWRPGT